MVPISGSRSSHAGFFASLLLAAVVIACLAALANSVIKKEERHEAEWDAGKGRPEAIELVRDPARDVTVELRKTIGEPVDWWSDCGYKYCKGWSIKHYPAIYKVGTLSQTEPGCFVGKPDNPVDSLMIASTRGGAYTFTYARDGKRFTVCAIGQRQDNDKIVIWSDDESAKR